MNRHHSYLTERRNMALQKPTCQSSTGWNLQSWLAVDGKAYLSLSENSCIFTNHDIWPWWAVDLQSVYVVHTVKITNSVDSILGKLLLFYLYTNYYKEV